MLLPKGTKLIGSKLLLLLCLPNIATHRASEIFLNAVQRLQTNMVETKMRTVAKKPGLLSECLDCEVQVSVDRRQFRTHRAKETDQEI